MYEYKAKVIDVYDGDSITVEVNLGFHIQHTIKVRLFSIDAPEIRGEEKDDGIKTKNRLSELILGKEIILKTYKDKQEKYGRWLGEIYLPTDMNKSINNLLIEEGLAKPYL